MDLFYYHEFVIFYFNICQNLSAIKTLNVILYVDFSKCNNYIICSLLKCHLINDEPLLSE